MPQHNKSNGCDDVEPRTECPIFPKCLRDKEQTLIDERRKQAAEGADCDLPSSGHIGLALSGGGVRSATFNLGVIHGLARAKVLRSFDYVSSVSGGSYVGSFLGRLYTRFITRPGGAVTIENRLADAQSPEYRWLRQNAKYLAPGGKEDWLVNVAVVFRSLLTLHVVVGTFLLFLFCSANLLRFAVMPWMGDQIASRLFLFTVVSFPSPQEFLVAGALRGFLGPIWSPWFAVSEAMFFLLVLPLMFAYWLASPDKPEKYQPAATVASLLIVAGIFIGALEMTTKNTAYPLLLLGPVLAPFIFVEAAWKQVRREYPGGLDHPSVKSIVRNILTRWLAVDLAAFFLLTGFALLDGSAFATFKMMSLANNPPAMAFGTLGTTIVAMYPILRAVIKHLPSAQNRNEPGWVKRILTQPGFLALVFGLPPLFLVCLASHYIFAAGTALEIGLYITIFAGVFSLIVGRKCAVTFINRSSLQAMYASRIARTYLGASNAERTHGRSFNDVTSVHPDDDISWRDYHPERAGGPLHLVNICVNQTIETHSGSRIIDRQGDNVAIGPCGISIGEHWHGIWDTFECSQPSMQAVTAIGALEQPHPFIGSPDNKSGVCVESLPLSTWISISGAAISPGRGQGTNISTALLFTLCNLRTGYWWNSGIGDQYRPGLPEETLWERVKRIPARFFRTQTLLMKEFTAAYEGPLRRYWYLSDGGFFDNTGLYELIRRRVRYIVCCDASEDGKGQLSDLANFVRKARIDFDAEVEFLDASKIAELVSTHSALAHLPTVVGTPSEVASSFGLNAKRHCAIGYIRYNEKPEIVSVLVYIKTGLMGDEPVDVVSYRAETGKFPNDPTTDQFFDEAQWESYRELGERIISKVFPPGSGFWPKLLPL